MCKKGHLNLFVIFIFLLCSGMIHAGINNPDIPGRGTGNNITSRYSGNDSLNIKPAAAKRLELINGDGGEVWQIGTTKLISWRSNGVGPITIEVTTNGGTSWSTIVNGVDASDGSYAWYIDPASYSSSINTRIRITEIDPTLPLQDESAADFTLSKLSLISPSAGEKLQVNSSYQIRWNASSDILNVKIEYSSDGNVWNTLATVPANSGSYTWFVNAVPSASARIRVSNAALSSIEAVSGPFAVCSLQLLSPNGGNSFFSGETRTITWNSTNVTNVSIEYSVNNGLTWTSVTGSTPAGTGNYLWTIPDAPSKDVLLRISDVSASHISDLSDSKFSIYSLSVLAPNTRLGWIINSSRSINWVTNVSGNVKIELSTDNGNTWPVQLASGVITPANQGTVTITVPDLPTDRARIKITSIDNPAYYDISDTYFTIGSLALTYPAGGEIWQAGGVYDILWTSSGLNTVRIEYSTDGLLWNTITNSAPAAPGSYSWNIPSNLNSTTLKIRISESETGTDISSTSSPVTVTNLSLISPNSSSIAWEAGTRQNITWSNNSSVTNVNIDYSTDNGNTWNSIAANYPAAGGIYQWNIPSEISSKTVRIRVSSSANSAVSYIGAPFRIGNIEVTSPNGGEKLFAGRGYTISWTKSSSIDRVRIQYSVDGGLTFTTIASNITGLSYNWQVPNTLQSLDARIRITDSDFPAIDDTSNNSAVIASINIVNPNGGGGYFVGSTVPITWTSSSINQVRIDYSTNNGLTWLNIVPSMAANAGPYSWTVPPSATSQALIRITDLENPSYYDQSDNTFHISSIALNSPNGGENLQTGSQKIISWSNSTDITAVDIELSVDNGATWLTIADSIPSAPGSFSWNIGNTPSSSALIRVSDAGNPGINDQSNSVFTIKQLLLTSPNGGEFITADSLYNITWNSANIANVMLEFSTDNGSTWSVIKASTPAAARVYSWRVPFSSTTRALVRISDADNLSDNIRDLSNATFTINSLLLLSPNGGENFVVNGTQVIRWISHQSIANLKIEYSTNNGTTWNLIEASFPAGNKSYSWTVPNRLTSLARIKLTSTSNTDIKDSSDNTFSIGSIAVQSPNGSERWQSGTTKNITWTNISSVAAIKIEYTTNNGAKWYTIASGVNAQNETYSWIVPDSATSMARIRISDMDHPEIKDSSNNVFTIASLKLLSPNGGEVLQTGTAYKIKWKASNVTYVNIEYSADNGLNWSPVTTGYSAAAGSLTWSVYNNPSQTALIRITDAGDAAINDRSDNTFIVKTLNLASPNGGEVIAANSTKNITWTGNGVNRIKLQYSTDSGSSWNLIADNVDGLSGSYLWTVPDLEKNTCRIKISDINSPVVTDSSSSNFMIAKLDVTKPVAGEVWQNGTTKQITWTASAGIPAVKIEFFNGASWQTIHNAYDASIGNYAWTIPVGISTAQARVKISYTRNGTTISDSSDQFIVNSLQITSPNGSAFWQSGTVKKIEWNSTIVENIKIEYSLDSAHTWNTIAGSYPAVNGFYNWNIPSTLDSRNLYFRISDVTKPGIYDISDAAVKAGWIKVISPAADSIWQSEKIRRITWQTSSSVSQLKLEYTTDGTAWNVINADAVSSSSGGYNWSIPADRSSAISMIRIYDAESSRNIIAQSELFTLVYLKVTSPVSGNNWQAGSTRNVTWNASNLIPFVNIYYSVNNGQSWSAVASNVDASLQSIAWNIPVNAATTNCLIRIDAASKPYISAINTGKLTISNLSLTSPVGNENWQAGSTKELSWTSTNIDNIRLEYSVDNGGSWNLIAGNIASALGKYSWTIPSALSSNQAKIRISKSSDAAISSTSSIFTIKRLSVTAPNGGEVWQAGSSKQIRWTEGYVNQVNLYYSVNGGMNWLPITSSYNAALGQYNWTIPNELSTSQARIKITDASNSEIKDSSDNVFSIGSLQITTPSGVEEWQSGTTKQIQWNSVSLGEAELHYTTDNGTSWQLITPSVSTVAGSYSWQIAPALSSEQVRVRLRTKDSTIVSTSNIFKIKRLDLTSPNGAEKWQSGSQKTISWTSGAVSNVNLYYSSDGGSNWQSIATGLNAPAGSYTWTIPQNYSTVQGRIRITDASNSVIRDSSQSNFSIVSLALTTPIAAAEWQSGTQKNITWTGSNTGNVSLRYSLDNGATWNNIAGTYPSSSGAMQWTIPSNISSSAAKIRIISNDDPAIFNESPVFTIKRLNVVSPNAGSEIWQSGTTKQISWASGLVNQVNISYSTNGGTSWTAIANNYNSALSTFSWDIPAGLKSTQALVRVIDSSNPVIRDSSDNVFVIGTLSVTSPVVSDEWQAGTTNDIKWNADNLGDVQIHYSTNNGASWQSVIQRLSAPGSYRWNLPQGIYSNQTKVRIRVVSDTTISAESQLFTIKQLNVVSPLGSEKWQAGSTQKIKWSKGLVNNINIYYSTNGGTNWNTIAANYNSALMPYNWTIPANVTSGQALIKIVDAANAKIKDSSRTSFVIGNLQVSEPLASAEWQAGTIKNIKWTSSYLDDVKIEYTLNNGASWSTIINSYPSASGSYAWTIPSDKASNLVKIRVSVPADTSFSSTTGVFTIKRLSVTAPNGGEVWQAGSSKQIRWTEGYVNQVNLYYSVNGGMNWLPITSSYNAALGQYNWTIPNELSTSQARIKITDASNSEIKDSSDNVFSIGSLQVTTPSGAEEWQSGTTKQIQWNSVSLGEAELHYTTDNGTSWQLITPSVSTVAGSYSWQIAPALSSEQVRVRLRTKDSTIVSTSNIFKIKRLDLTSPNGAEKWQSGSQKVISWTSGAVSNVNLYYSSDGGSNWQSIATGLNAPAGSYTWTIPQNYSTVQGRIRITDASNSVIRDSSQSNFSIVSLALTTPIAAAEWQSGTQKNITWNSSNLTDVEIQYTTDNGVNWKSVVSSVTASLRSAAWNIPENISSSQARIRIRALADTSVFSISEIFKIKRLHLDSPNGGNVLQAGTANTISWTSGQVPNVNISYSTNGGAAWTVIAANVNSALTPYSWNVPEGLNTQNALVKITDASNAAIKDSSDNVFSIGTLKLTSPLGGEQWQAGRTQKIQWQNGSSDQLIIEYSLNGGAQWSVLQGSVPAQSGTYNWTIPDSFATAHARIRIKELNAVTLISQSADFTISRLAVTVPSAKEYWQAGKVKDIKWVSGSVNNIKIDLSTDNGASWSVLAASLPAAGGKYNWNIPGNISSLQTLIRISDAANPAISDTINTPIVIGNVAVTAPNNGEMINAGSRYPITWSNSSSVQRVRIELSTNRGNTWSAVINDAPASGSYQWNVPSGIVSDSCLIRVSDAASGNQIYDVSDNAFTITSLALTTPNGGEDFQFGSAQNITWTAGPGIGNIKIEYYTKASGWKLIQNNVPANPGSFAWTVPNDASDSAKVRLSSAVNPTFFDVSDSTFRIANIVVSLPNGAGKYQAGTTSNITWTATSNVKKVNLYYSVNNGASWIPVASEVNAASGSYAWLIPDNPSVSALVRAVDAESDNRIKDNSDAAFTISRLAVTQPAGGEKWLAGSTQVLKWTASADINTVELYYSVNGGTTWNLISDNVPAASELSWSIPMAMQSNNCRILVKDKSTPSIQNQSGVFSVYTSTLTLASLTGGEYIQSGSRYDVKWQVNNSQENVNNVVIELSTDNGTTWSAVTEAPVPAAQLSYSWLVPRTTVTSQARIRVKDAVNPFINSASSSAFTIGWVQLVAPDGGEYWQAGARKDITWQRSNNVAGIKIEFSSNNGTSWTTVTPSAPAAAGSYAWTVPNLSSAQALIRISDALSSYGIKDSSSTKFIISSLALASPNGNETFQAGKTMTVRWMRSSDIVNVDLKYSLDSGAVWKTVNDVPIDAATGQYVWTIPENLCSDKALLKISNTAYPEIQDISNSSFIVKLLKVKDPFAGNTWQVGTTHAIKWEACGLTNVRIEYSTNNGTSWSIIQANTAAALQTYDWMVPNTISSSALVKITDLSDGNVNAVSSLFTIYKPSVALTSPNGGEIWQAGRKRNITWTSSFADTLKIELSTDNGTSWNTISAAYPAQPGQFQWNIPSDLSTSQALVRITDTKLASVTSASASVFSICQLTVTSPSGGEYWQTGSPRVITWQGSSNISKVRIHYSLDGGTSWNEIVEANNFTASTDTFSWNVPALLSSANAKIKVLNAADTSVYAVSNGLFKLGWLQVNSPSAGQVYQAGRNVSLTWNNSSSISVIKIDLYNMKTGQLLKSLQTATGPAGGSASVPLPDNLETDSAYIRISDLNSSLAIKAASSVFTVSNLRIITPSSGDNWAAGSMHNIQWYNSSDISLVDVEYSTSPATGWKTIARNVPAAGGSLPWNIPLNISSNQCYIRVSNSSRPGIKDTSDAFNIYIASLTLVSPNGGECLQAGKTYPIKWNSRFVSSIQIEFSYDGGATWPDTVRPVSAADSVWNWNVPSGKSTTAALVRIKDIANLSLSDQSNAAFKIGWVDVTSPAPGANMLAGSLQTITWDHSPSVSYVNIYYTTSPNPSDTSWLPVAAYIRATDKSFKWNPVPSVGSTGAKIRITDAVSNKQISDISDNFTISILRLTYPNGGELWQSGAAYKVKWACSGNLNGVRIQLSTNNGRTWNYSEIADAQSREFSWQVAEGLYTDSALFRISDLSNPSIADSSDRRFQIGALDLASFNDGAKVLAGSVKKIEWAMTGNIKYVDIHYKTSPKGTWKPVAISVPAQNNQYNWKVPDEPSDSCFIRIRNSYSPWYKDSSDVPFTIARLKLLSPNTPQVWQTGTQKDIVWDSKFIDNIIVEYTTDSIFTEIQTVQAGNGKYSWSIPDNINLANSNYRIRLRDQLNPQISDTSSSKFSVAYLKLLQPNGGGGQQIGTEYKVTWLASTNTLSKVNLYVKTSEVSQYIKINTAPITASDPEYLWKITTMPSRECWIKVEDANNPSIYDESDQTFTISEIALIYPNGGKYQKFQVGRTDKIKWSSKFVDSVEILYSPRPDLGYKTIGYAKGTANEFNWTITAGDYYPTKTGRIMVRDASFNSVRDNSDTTFTISQIKVTAPNSREAWQINTDKVIRWEAENVDSVIVYLNPGNKQPLITIKGPLQSSASGSYVWSIPSNIRVSQAKIKVVDFHNSNIYDESDTTFLIGSTPHVVTAEKYQSRKITLLLNFDSQGDTIDLIDFSYRKPNNIFWTSAAAGLDSSYINIQGPVSQYKIKWNSDAVINDFEGKVDLKLDFKSNYNIMYTVELDSVGIDNKAPQFDPSKIRITQKPVRLGWDKAIISWDNASELNKPVKYSLYPDMNAALPYVETADDTAIVRNMQTATNYMMKLKVSDALGNNASYTFPYKTVAACDFSADNAINAADLAAFVAAWSNPDSVNGADLYPYQGSVPRISVNGDKMLQVEDLLVFVDMWNYFQINRSLPKEVSSDLLFAQNSERKLLKLTKGDGGLSFPVEFDSASGVISFSAEVHYNNSSIKFDSLGIGGSTNDGNAVCLVYNDSSRGIVHIDYAELSGKMGSSYSIASKLKCNFDRLSERDSVMIMVKGYNRNLKEVASRNVVYTLQEVPRTFALYQNYPNPFNPATTIEYDLPAKAKVNLTLYDILGRQVAVLVNEEQNEGKHTFRLNASAVNGGLASGVYLYRIHSGDNSVTKKMILLK